MTTYRGSSALEGTRRPVSVMVYPEGRPPYPLRHLIVHSPSGLSWGYQGSGPADLALAILADYLGEAAAIPPHTRFDHAIVRRIEETGAWLLHQAFKRDLIARLPLRQPFTLDGAVIDAWLAPRRAEMERRTRERRLLALLGQRVACAGGAVVDVRDVTDDPPEALLVVAVGQSAPYRTVALDAVVRVIGPTPDDEDEGAEHEDR